MTEPHSSHISLELDGSNDLWLEAIREAEAPLPLGRLGKYELMNEISRGGQGVVYRARQPGTQREVALKRMVAGSFATPGMHQRFQREIETAASLNHRNIVTVYGSDEIDGQPLLTMEWIDGVPVNQWSWRQGGRPRSRTELVDMFIRICDAVQHAHLRGVIHRDLKPSNILVDAHHQPHVLDFGLAKLVQAQADGPAAESTTAQFVGTIAYAAPEQLHAGSQDVDVRTDIYALGVVFYEMLTRQRPYEIGTDLTAALQTIHTQDPQRPSRLQSEVDGDLDAIVLKMLEKDKQRRYQSVHALADDLRRYGAGEAVLAHPPSVLYQLGKLIRRHKAPFVSAAAVLLLVVMFGAGSFYLWRNAEVARDNERAARASESEARRVAEHITAFLQDMLVSVDPHVAGGALTVREVLDRAALQIDGELAQSPEVQAGVQHTIGSTYQSLGLYTEAHKHLRAALDTRVSVLGKRHPEVAQSLNALGRLAHDMGDYDEAQILLSGALEMKQELLGPRHLAVAEALNDLGRLQVAQGAYEQAEEHLREALNLRQELLGEADPRLAETMYQLGSLLTDAARYDEAEPLYRDALAIMSAHYPGDHPEVADSLRRLGRFLLVRAEYEESEERLITALDMSRRLWTEQEHPDTVRIVGHLATLHQKKGDYESAAALFRAALASNRSLLGDEHPEVGSSMSNLAEVLRAMGQYQEARTFLEQALELGRKNLGDEHPNVATRRNNLAALLYAQEDYAAALPLFEESLAINRRIWGAEHPHVATSLNNLGKLLHAAGDYQAAETYLREALKLSRQIDTKDHPTIALRAHNLAKTLQALEDYDQAETYYREALDIRRQALGNEHRHTAQSLHALGRLLLIDGEPQTAEPLLREAFEVRHKVLGAEHWHTAYTRSIVGECLTALAQYEEAEEHLVAGYAVMKDRIGADHARSLEVLERLVALYEAWGFPDSAADYRAQLPEGPK